MYYFKNHFILLFLLFSFIFTLKSQNEFYSVNEGFNRNYAINILRDSIWLKYELWKTAGRSYELTQAIKFTEETAKKVDFYIIPSGSFVKDDTTVFSFEEPLIKYFQIDTGGFYAIIRYKNVHLGFLEVGNIRGKWEYRAIDYYSANSGYNDAFKKIYEDVGEFPNMIFYFDEVLCFFYIKNKKMNMYSISRDTIRNAKELLKLISTQNHIQRHIRGEEYLWWKPERARQNLK